MKKIIYTLLLSVPVASGLTSCNDAFLERYPEGKVTEKTAFVSYESSYAFLLGLYDIFNNEPYYGGIIPQNNAMGTATWDQYSGLLTNYANGAGTPGNSFAAQTETVPTEDGTYSNPYTYIRRANLMLQHLSEPEATPDQRTHLEAIARFFRAFSHYALMKNYGDAVYVDGVLTEDDERVLAARDSRLYVADQIYKELVWCKDNIKDDIAEPNTVNSDVVKALLSRFTLFEGTWRKYHNTDESECAANGYITGQKLLEECAKISDELITKYPNIYQGDPSGGDTYPGAGWGQLWTTDNLAGTPGVLMYMKYSEDYKLGRLGHFELIGAASLEMPQSTVDLYLTKDGLPIHNSQVKYYDYKYNPDGADSYVEGEKYDYAHCDIYKTFRNRDPRLLMTVMPPYHVYAASGSNDYTYDTGHDGKFMEYLKMFPSRGLKTEETNDKGTIYRIPAVQTAYYLLQCHKGLPSGNWGGNIQPNVPNTQLSDNFIEDGNIAFYSSKTYQRGKSGYFVWKHHACWDRQDQNVNKEIADKPLFKIEEVMLNYAEAMWELGKFDGTVLSRTINVLRQRAGVAQANLGDWNAGFDPDRDQDVDPVLWEIRRERLIEQMGEGFSWDDIRRWKKGDWYVNKQQYGAFVEDPEASKIKSITQGATGILDLNTGFEASSIPEGGGHLYYYQDPVKAGKGWLDKYYLRPIPSSELLFPGTQLKQNEAWL